MEAFSSLICEIIMELRKSSSSLNVNSSIDVSICDSREGLVQEITFDEKVIVAKPVTGGAEKKGPCQDFNKLTTDYKTFRFKLDSRECFQGFVGEDSLTEHMLMTIGHEDIIIRE